MSNSKNPYGEMTLLPTVTTSHTLDPATKERWGEFLERTIDVTAAVRKVLSSRRVEEEFPRVEIRDRRLARPESETRGAHIGDNPQTGERMEMTRCWVPDGRLAAVMGWAGELVHTDLGLFDVDAVRPARTVTLDPRGRVTAEMEG